MDVGRLKLDDMWYYNKVGYAITLYVMQKSAWKTQSCQTK